VQIGEGARPRAPRGCATTQRCIFVLGRSTAWSSVAIPRPRDEDAIPPGRWTALNPRTKRLEWRPRSVFWCSGSNSRTTPQARVPLSGHLFYAGNPGLKPWAMICSRFVAKSEQPPGLFSQTISWFNTFHTSNLEEPLLITTQCRRRSIVQHSRGVPTVPLPPPLAPCRVRLAHR
jgi:hypothetical protein